MKLKKIAGYILLIIFIFLAIRCYSLFFLLKNNEHSLLSMYISNWRFVIPLICVIALRLGCRRIGDSIALLTKDLSTTFFAVCATKMALYSLLISSFSGIFGGLSVGYMIASIVISGIVVILEYFFFSFEEGNI